MSVAPPPAERLRSLARRARGAMTLGKPTCGPGPLQRLVRRFLGQAQRCFQAAIKLLFHGRRQRSEVLGNLVSVHGRKQ